MLHLVRRVRPALLAPLATAVVAPLALAGCTADAPGAGDETVVAVLLADDEAPRWRERDLPALERQLAGACPECRVRSEVADGDPAVQARQLEESLDEGADVVVLQATSAEAGEEFVAAAGEVPVVAYDRYLPGATHLVSGDGAAIGRAQARAVVRGLGLRARGARVLLVDDVGGDAAEDARRRLVRRGLQDAGAQVLAALDPETATADEARRWTAQVLARRGPDAVDAVVAASDVQAGGVLEAFRDADVAAAELPPVVGHDADLQAVRRVVADRQLATVWTDVRAMADRAAEVAAALARGREVPRPDDGAEPTRQVEGVPTDVVAPVAVGRDDVAAVLVREGVVSIEELCDAATRDACRRAGLA